MKTKVWIALLAGLFVLCALSAFLLLTPGREAVTAEILSDGKVVRMVDLRLDQQFTVPSPTGGYNTVTVKDGKIAVTEASCPDHYCAKRGFCNSGAQIVCLPNRLVIRFAGEQEVDMAAG